ncbi:MAG: T9SS type A sorting domain-containing protein [Rhodothermales bacterium]
MTKRIVTLLIGIVIGFCQSLSAQDYELNFSEEVLTSFDGDLVIEGDRVAVSLLTKSFDREVYIFERGDNGGWDNATKIELPDSVISMARQPIDLDSDRLIVGVPEGGVSLSGVVYVYKYDNNTWEIDATLLAPEGFSDLAFGAWVTISGDLAVVSADCVSFNCGAASAAFVYQLVDEEWRLVQKIEYPFQSVEMPVDLDQGSLIVSITTDRSIYIYKWSGEFFEEQQIVRTDVESAVGGLYGTEADLDGDFIIVGNRYAQYDNIIVYHFDGTKWNQLSSVVPPSILMDENQFQGNISISENIMVLGSTTRDALVYQHQNGQWNAVSQLAYSLPGSIPSNARAHRADVDGDRAVVAYRNTGVVVHEGLLRYNVALEEMPGPSIQPDISLYPNPANEKITVSYETREASLVKTWIVDVLGRKRLELVNYVSASGRYETTLPVGDLVPGYYFCIIESAEGSNSIGFNVLK